MTGWWHKPKMNGKIQKMATKPPTRLKWVSHEDTIHRGCSEKCHVGANQIWSHLFGVGCARLLSCSLAKEWRAQKLTREARSTWIRKYVYIYTLKEIPQKGFLDVYNPIIKHGLKIIPSQVGISSSWFSQPRSARSMASSGIFQLPPLTSDFPIMSHLFPTKIPP